VAAVVTANVIRHAKQLLASYQAPKRVAVATQWRWNFGRIRVSVGP
jgi:hypothetical protein